MRKPDQITVDRALLVYLLRQVESLDSARDDDQDDGPHNPMSDVKLQQLAFLSALQMFNKGVKGFHCEFFRYAYGAFSKDLDNDLTSLRRRGRVENFSVTEEAQAVAPLLQEAVKDVEPNRQALGILEAVVAHYGPQDTGTITNSVEAVELSTPERPDFKLAIRDISFHTILLVPHRIEVPNEFTLPPAVLARLNTAMGY
jgi:hypothetical protein